MLKTIFNWFTGKPLSGTTAPDVKPESAPYKVEAPQVAPVQAPAPVAEEPKAAPKKARKPAAKKPAAAIKAPAKSRKKST